jgi:hypothetical protein
MLAMNSDGELLVVIQEEEGTRQLLEGSER